MTTSTRGRLGSSSSSSPVKILSVKEGIPITVRFLGRIYGINTHWKAGHSVHCDGDGECPPTLHRTVIIWKGYSAVQAWDATDRLWRPHVLEVTEGLEEILRNRELRGEVWTLSRQEGGKKTAPVKGVFNERLADDALAKEFPIEPVLIRVFRCSHLNLGKVNPLPPKVMLEPERGEAPNYASELVDKSEPAKDPQAIDDVKKAWEKQQEKLSFRDRVRLNGSNGEKTKVEESSNGR